jgi:predicted deacylase
VLNGAQIPAATIELGSWMHIDPYVVRACTCGLRNVMRWLGMLPGDPDPIEGIRVLKPAYPVRRHIFPYAPMTGSCTTCCGRGRSKDSPRQADEYLRTPMIAMVAISIANLTAL